jgi:tetratricopeptide (TPR) repeat protein
MHAYVQPVAKRPALRFSVDNVHCKTFNDSDMNLIWQRRVARVSTFTAITAVSLLTYSIAQAQTIKDLTLRQLHDGGRYAELVKAAQTALAARPDDMDAYTAATLGAASSEVPLAAREAVLKSLEACAERLPQSAVCHWGVATVSGSLALSGGMLKAMQMAPKIKAAYVRAVEADPLYWPAREGLVRYYLMAPAIAGGSKKLAMETAAAEQARQPERAKLLKGMVHMSDKAWDRAQAEIASIKVGDDAEMREDLADAWVSLGFSLLGDKQYARAKALFEQTVKDNPAEAYPLWGLARTQLELQQYDDAIANLQKVPALKGGSRIVVDYRLGIAYQGKGDKAAAKAAFERALKHKAITGTTRKDIDKRMQELEGS